MKKLFLLAALFISTAVFASESAVKEVIRAYRTADAAMDIRALNYLTKDFTVSVLGKKIGRNDLIRVHQNIKIMMETDNLETFMEAALRMQGATLTADQRKQIRAMKDSDKKHSLQSGKNSLKYLMDQAALGVKSLSFKKCVIKGNNAEAAASYLEPTSGATVTATYRLVKQNGKWLIKSMKMDIKK